VKTAGRFSIISFERPTLPGFISVMKTIIRSRLFQWEDGFHETHSAATKIFLLTLQEKLQQVCKPFWEPMA
jgi:hypothetical protein